MKKLLLSLSLVCGLTVSAQQFTPVQNTLVSYQVITNALYKMFPTNYWHLRVITNVLLRTNLTYNTTNYSLQSNVVIVASNLWFKADITNIPTNLLYGNINTTNFDGGTNADGTKYLNGYGKWTDPLVTSVYAYRITNISPFTMVVPFAWKSNATVYSNAFNIINGQIFSVAFTNF